MSTNKKLKLSAIALAVAFPMTAAADGWYANISGGVAGVKNKIDKEVVISEIPATVRLHDAKYKAGFRASGAVGYKMDNFRVEAELSHIRANLKDIDGTIVGPTPTAKNEDEFSGRTSATAVMANVYYDFDGVMDGITPYVGVGIGGARVITKADANAGNHSIKLIDVKSTELAGQAIAGVRFDVSDNVAVNADYRYLRTAKTAAGTPFQAHSANVGLTVFFG